MDEQIVSSKPYMELVDDPYVAEYIDLAFQKFALVSKSLDLVGRSLDLVEQLSREEATRLKIREDSEHQREIIERRMNQLDAELEADLEKAKNVINVSLRVFEKLIEDGCIDQAMTLHERIINHLSDRVSIAANKFNQNNPDGQVRFHTT